MNLSVQNHDHYTTGKILKNFNDFFLIVQLMSMTSNYTREQVFDVQYLSS